MRLSICIVVLLALALTRISYGSEQNPDFICDAEMLNCRVADADMALGDRVGFFDQEGKLYAIGEVVNLEVGIRDVEIIQLFSRIADDAIVRVITDAERKDKILDKHNYLPKYLIGVSFAYKHLALVDSLAGFDYGVYLARRVHDNLSFHMRSSYAYVDGVIEREEIDTPRHIFDVQAIIMSFYPGISYEAFPRQPLSLLLEFGAGIVAVNIARPDGVKVHEHTHEKIAGTHLLLRAMVGLQLNVRSWRLQAGVAQRFIGSTGVNEFTTTLAKGI